MRQTDFEEWEDSPEQYLEESELTHFEEHLHPATETLLLHIIGKFPEISGNFLIEMIQNIIKVCSPGTIGSVGSQEWKNMLLKESIYW